MHTKFLQCIKCSKIYNKNKIIFRCTCGASLDVVYDYKKMNLSWRKIRKRPFNHWRYREFFPIKEGKNIISLKEGGTPLIPSKIIGKKLGIKLFFKFEGVNPTGSFKDRGTTVEISKAIEFGAKKIICASTGNMGASVSAYSSVAGIDATIFIPKATTTKSKINQIKIYGSTIKFINGDYTAALKASLKEWKKNKAYLMGDYPYRGEGEKSVSYEISDDTGTPDFVIAPVGNGTLLSGMWKGFKEMKIVGLASRLPKFIGVQATGCNTIVDTFSKNYVKKVYPSTKASAIACGDPLDGLKALRSIKESGGYGIAVSDNEMNAARKILAREGIYAEMSGAAPLAALLKNKLPKNSTVVLVVTGHGLKDI